MKKKATPQPQSDTSLKDLFVAQLRDILWTEQKLTKALPKMAKAATNGALRQALLDHLEETEGQINRLTQVFEEVDETMRAKKCEAMEGLLKEGDEIKEEFKGTSVLDAGLIVAAQKVEHYEIATYGSLVTFARRLGHHSAANLLQENLDEEKAADVKLTEIAESSANEEAESGNGSKSRNRRGR
ncbi:MAG: ferritin-like domain-containing protein [Verrucomicrobiales bacterium]